MLSSPLRLSALQAEIRGALDEHFQGRTWWLIAELQDITDQGTRIFFSFLEKSATDTPLARMSGAVINAEAITSFRNFEDITGRKIEQLNGQQVLVRVAIVIHPTAGIRLNTLDISHEFMLGQLEQQRQATLRKLLSKPGIQYTDGKWHSPNKMLQLPRVIQRIAVISSAAAAGYEDFTHKLQTNLWQYSFHIEGFFTLVQGDSAAEAMKNQLLLIHERMQQSRPFDVVVIIRGGGAQSDLLPFDQFILAHPVSRFPIPIITGIGHQKNESITDLMAHTSVKTPTEAAQFIINHNHHFEEQLLKIYTAVLQQTQTRITQHRLHLEKHTTTITSGTRLLMNTMTTQLTRTETKISAVSLEYIRHTTISVNQLKDQVNNSSIRFIKNQATRWKLIHENIISRIPIFMERQQQQLNFIEERIRLLSPETILKRGYAYVSQGDSILTKAQQAQFNQPLVVHFKDGKLTTTINTITSNE
jgi:exodeoxyribonuclease VII large subunit